MKNLKQFKQLNEWGGSLHDIHKQPGKDLERFLKDFYNGLDNVFIMSMLHRMLDTNDFTKNGKLIYDFTNEELTKLEKIKPMLDNLVKTISSIKAIQDVEA